MSYVDLYGRNPEIERTSFAYPYPLMSDTPPLRDAVTFFKPPESNPVFGVVQDFGPDADDTVALVDPTNSRYTSNRERGTLMGLGAYDPLDGLDGLNGCSPRGFGRGMASDLGLAGYTPGKGRIPVSDSAYRSPSGPPAWGSPDGWPVLSRAAAWYRGSSGYAQVAMLGAVFLVGWNVLKKV